MIDRDPTRFVFEIPSFDENLVALETLYALLRTHCPKLEHIVITVSPVALAATFSGQDIVVANMQSKTLLLAAATSWSRTHENVNYFPSFEMAYYSHPDKAWLEDRRHPSVELVSHIIDCFLRHYLNSGEAHE